MNEFDRHDLRAENFVYNNGQVVLALNVLRHEYHKLSGVQSILEKRGIAEDEFLDCIHFLSRDGYIGMRTIEGKATVVGLSDDHYEDLEAVLTNKAIRLLMGKITDDAIEVKRY